MTRKPSRQRTTRRSKPKDPHRYPKGWNRKRVEAVLAHYENQTEDEAAYKDGAFAMIQVPIELVAAVQKLIAKRAG